MSIDKTPGMKPSFEMEIKAAQPQGKEITQLNNQKSVESATKRLENQKIETPTKEPTTKQLSTLNKKLQDINKGGVFTFLKSLYKGVDEEQVKKKEKDKLLDNFAKQHGITPGALNLKLYISRADDFISRSDESLKDFQFHAAGKSVSPKTKTALTTFFKSYENVKAALEAFKKAPTKENRVKYEAAYNKFVDDRIDTSHLIVKDLYIAKQRKEIEVWGKILTISPKQK